MQVSVFEVTIRVLGGLLSAHFLALDPTLRLVASSVPSPTLKVSPVVRPRVTVPSWAETVSLIGLGPARAQESLLDGLIKTIHVPLAQSLFHKAEKFSSGRALTRCKLLQHASV